MPLLKQDLTRSNSAAALLLIDVINDLDFERAEDLLMQAVPMAKAICALKRRAAQWQIPIVYVNDNFGQWKSDFRKTVEHCCAAASVGGAFAFLLFALGIIAIAVMLAVAAGTIADSI